MYSIVCRIKTGNCCLRIFSFVGQCYKTLKTFFLHTLTFRTPSSCLSIDVQIFVCNGYWRRHWCWSSLSFVVLNPLDPRNLILLLASKNPEHILPPRVSAMGTFEYQLRRNLKLQKMSQRRHSARQTALAGLQGKATWCNQNRRISRLPYCCSKFL